jgi:SAM-dependent methyltransferase
VQVIEKSWADFWAYYWRVEHRHAIPGIKAWDEQLVAFIEQACELRPEMRLLDLACGGGDQAALFAARGYGVVGLDIAPPLVAYARERFGREGLHGEFICGDMREIAYDGEFDAVLVLSGSFGFFGDEGDQELLGKIARALKPGGRAFIMYLCPPACAQRERTWRRVRQGLQLTEDWFDHETSTRCGWIAIIQDDGTMLRPSSEPGYYTADERIRCYTVPEMRRMLATAGLEPVGFFGRDMSLEPGAETPRDIVVARRA